MNPLWLILIIPLCVAVGAFLGASKVLWEMSSNEHEDDMYAVTGTFHGAIVYAGSEGEARRTFHQFYKGESILSIEKVKL